MLVQLCEVEKFLGEAGPLLVLLLNCHFKPQVLRFHRLHGLRQVLNAVMASFVFVVPNKLALGAAKDDSWAGVLVFENVFIICDLLAASRSVLALELKLP